ncbi:hypothetical protein KSS87_018259 [Heliosperma pusillum]|nr:hypothetical protein KSS87_018259 [Heliosperma pusillum]
MEAAAPPPGDVGMEATSTQRPAVTSDPSQAKQQQQQPNPNPNYPQSYNMQPAWVGSQQLQLQSCSTGMAVGVPANSPSPSPARPCLPQHTSMSPAVGLPHPQPTLSQNFQGHGNLRASAVMPSTSAPGNSQSQLASRQPWLSTQHGRPSISSLRPQATSQTLQQRTHIPQQSLQPMPASSQPQQLLSFQQQQQHQQQQQFPTSIPSQDNLGQQLLPSRNPQPVMNQQQISRVQSSGHQRPPSPVMGQTAIMHSAPTDNVAAVEPLESCTRILSKRSIQELVNQVDPLEKLDPEVEDVLVDIADDFIDSVTTFGCSLAKHRKSNTLEAKDILLHLERTWNMTLPGFSGDEIKTYKKPVANEIHKERLAVIKKSYWS